MDTNDYIKAYKLNIDPELPHHYIIGVAFSSAISKNPGQPYLKYGPIYFTNDDIIDINHAADLTKDKLFPTSNAEAIAAYDSKNIVTSLTAMKLSANANMATLHHFSSKDPIEDELFVSFVSTAHLKSTKKLLDAARIN